MTPSDDGRSISPSEALALLYLAAPVALFFVAALAREWAWPALTLLGLVGLRIGRRTAGRWQPRKRSLLALALAVLWVFASGNFGVLQANEDWSKHYALLNILAGQAWWPAGDDGVLRYSLGWYLLPALAMKLTAAAGLTATHGLLFSGLWSLLGLLIFFSLIEPLFGSVKRWMVGMLAFALFAGGDLWAACITGNRFHIPFHWEWWAGWIQYSGTTTALFWAPQHALSAWLGIGLLLRRFTSTDPGIPPLLIVSLALFWSPFAALGLLPFALFVQARHWRSVRAIDLPALGAAVLIGIPLLIFLQTDTAAIPKSFIWSKRCVMSGAGCFSWPGLVFFLLMEIGGAALVMAVCRDRERERFGLLALLCLCLIPTVRIGLYSDFAMRASLPALCVLALVCARALATERSLQRGWVAAAVLLLGAAVPLSELYRGATAPFIDYQDHSLAAETAGREALKPQYFARRRPLVLAPP